MGLRIIKQKRLLAFIIIALVFAMSKLIGTFGQTVDANIFLDGPTDMSSVTSATYKIMVSSFEQSVGFVSVKINFDKNLLNMSSPVSVTGPLKTEVIITSQSTANDSGSVEIVLGLSPSDVQNAPSGSFEIAEIQFNKVGEPNGSTQLTFSANDLSVVNMDAQQLSVEATDTTINFDPIVTPTFTPTPPELTPTITSSPTPTETQTPTVTSTPTLTITPTPTISLSPTPTPVSNEPATLSLFPKSDYKVNKQSEIDINLSITSPVIGVDAVILYDPQFIEIISVNNNGLFNGNFTYLDDKLGTLRLSATMTPQESIASAGVFATINVLPKKPGSTSIDFSFNSQSRADSNVIAQNGEDILSTTNGVILDILDVEIFAFLNLMTSSESLEIGHVATGSMEIIGGDWKQIFVTDKDGKSQTWQLDGGMLDTNPIFSLKTNGYLRKNLAQTLGEGTNVLNFGKLLAGDLNDDGIVNNIDIALMYQSWFGAGDADYNKDGIVNSYDFGIVVNNFFKEDE